MELTDILRDEISLDRLELVRAMRVLSRYIAREADRLEKDPSWIVSELGYLGNTSLSTKVDSLAARLSTKERIVRALVDYERCSE